jgi:hypothetical protein
VAGPVPEPTRLSPGQRLLLGLAVAPACLSMALGTLVGLIDDGAGSATLGAVVAWLYVLFLVVVGAGAGVMAVTGRAPGPGR